MLEATEVNQGRHEEFPNLSPGELHLWRVSTEISPLSYEKCKNALSEKELSKVPFFKFEQVRDSFIVCQGTLRLLLSEYLSISPKNVNIGRRKKGKPYSLDDPGLYFNISNSGEMAVFAFSRDGEVGVDIEKIRDLPDLDELISKNFTSGEIRFINNKPEEKTKRFFRFWTVKESYLKAIGEGMRLTPDSIEFDLSKDRIRQLSFVDVFKQEDWNFKEFSIASEYVGTISYLEANVKIKLMEY